MNKAPLVVSPQALEDLEEMWSFIAQDNVEAADRSVLFSRKPVRAGRPSLTSLSGHIGRPGSFVIIRKWVFIG